MDIATLVGLVSGVTRHRFNSHGGKSGRLLEFVVRGDRNGRNARGNAHQFSPGRCIERDEHREERVLSQGCSAREPHPAACQLCIARREGILALESHASEAEDEFLEKSVQLAIDGTAPELIKDILTTELAFMEDRHAMGQSILVAMGTYAPAFGMIGTLIGLVQMLATLDDPSKIGEGMAVALLTTLYGALLANMVFLPGAGKLKVRTSNELLAKELVIEGILSIQSGDNPRVVEQKLKAFVSPAVRRQVSAV